MAWATGRQGFVPMQYTLPHRTMPLSANARDLMRTNLEQIRNGEKAHLIVIGSLTDAQLTALNALRAAEGFSELTADVVFIGKHIYQSRVAKDGYTIEDVLDQIESAMQVGAAILNTEKMTAIESPAPRADRYGNQVTDRGVFECTARHPRPELYGVVPKGDTIKPQK